MLKKRRYVHWAVSEACTVAADFDCPRAPCGSYEEQENSKVGLECGFLLEKRGLELAKACPPGTTAVIGVDPFPKHCELLTSQVPKLSKHWVEKLNFQPFLPTDNLDDPKVSPARRPVAALYVRRTLVYTGRCAHGQQSRQRSAGHGSSKHPARTCVHACSTHARTRARLHTLGGSCHDCCAMGTIRAPSQMTRVFVQTCPVRISAHMSTSCLHTGDVQGRAEDAVDAIPQVLESGPGSRLLMRARLTSCVPDC